MLLLSLNNLAHRSFHSPPKCSYKHACDAYIRREIQALWLLRALEEQFLLKVYSWTTSARESRETGNRKTGLTVSHLIKNNVI